MPLTQSIPGGQNVYEDMMNPDVLLQYQQLRLQQEILNRQRFQQQQSMQEVYSYFQRMQHIK